ncbi:alpha/beta hydrolase [Streptomyces sp. NPDC005202]|uniref:alpha/beta fold hydrolase n=1 Tax=Streptomyces sp. NPDC005202 TaxID=3157021 RepID=UPI0033B28CA2
MAGQVLPYELHGNGPHHVIALHGWFGDRTSFAALRPHLDRTAFTYAFLDCRGYGEAKDAEGAYTVEEIAEDVLAVADDLRWPEFSLLGHSMGGMAAQAVLLIAPERVLSIVGVSPVPASGVPFDEQGWQLFAGAAEEPGNRRAIIDFTTGNRLTGTWLDVMVRRSVDRSSVPAFRAYLDSWARSDFHERIQGNEIPVLVVAGEQDPALSPDVMQATWLKWYPHAELQVFADAGHYAVDEVPVALASVVERFLDR